MFDFPNFFNLGELSEYLSRLAGVWTLAGQYMSTMRSVGLAVWLFVATYGFYERFRFADDAEEYAYQILRSGLAFGAITYWPDLFDFFRTALNAWADAIGTRQSLGLLLRTITGTLTDPVRLAAMALLSALGFLFQIPFLLFLGSILFFFFAYVYLLIYQSVALSVAFILGPVALALYPSPMAGRLTAGYLKSTVKILLLPLLFSIFLDAFARLSIDLFRLGNFGFVQSVVLVIIAYTTLKLPKILDQLDSTLDTAGHVAGGLLVTAASTVTGFVTYLGFRAGGALVGAAAGPVGAAVGSAVAGGAAQATTRITSPSVQRPVGGGGRA